MTSQVIGSGAQGAEAGYKVGGGWGAVIGAVVGIGAGMFGNKAAEYRRKANFEEQRMADIRESQERRQLIRQAFISRSEALAAGASQETGGMQSSGVQGVLSSSSTQTFNNIKVFDALVARRIMQNYYLKKAKKQQDRSDSIMGIIQGINGGGGMGGGMGGGSSGGSSGSSGGGGGGMGLGSGMDMGSMGGYNA